MEKQGQEFLQDPLPFARSPCIQPGEFRNHSADAEERSRPMDGHRIFDTAKHSKGELPDAEETAGT